MRVVLILLFECLITTAFGRDIFSFNFTFSEHSFADGSKFFGQPQLTCGQQLRSTPGFQFKPEQQRCFKAESNGSLSQAVADSQGFALELWFSLRSQPGDIVFFGSPDNTLGLWLSYEHDTLNLRVDDRPVFQVIGNLKENVLHHFLLIYDSQSLTYYTFLNGSNYRFLEGARFRFPNSANQILVLKPTSSTATNRWDGIVYRIAALTYDGESSADSLLSLFPTSFPIAQPYSSNLTREGQCCDIWFRCGDLLQDATSGQERAVQLGFREQEQLLVNLLTCTGNVSSVANSSLTPTTFPFRCNNSLQAFKIQSSLSDLNPWCDFAVESSQGRTSPIARISFRLASTFKVKGVNGSVQVFPKSCKDVRLHGADDRGPIEVIIIRSLPESGRVFFDGRLLNETLLPVQIPATSGFANLSICAPIVYNPTMEETQLRFQVYSNQLFSEIALLNITLPPAPLQNVSIPVLVRAPNRASISLPLDLGNWNLQTLLAPTSGTLFFQGNRVSNSAQFTVSSTDTLEFVASPWIGAEFLLDKLLIMGVSADGNERRLFSVYFQILPDDSPPAFQVPASVQLNEMGIASLGVAIASVDVRKNYLASCRLMLVGPSRGKISLGSVHPAIQWPEGRTSFSNFMILGPMAALNFSLASVNVTVASIGPAFFRIELCSLLNSTTSIACAKSETQFTDPASNMESLSLASEVGNRPFNPLSYLPAYIAWPLIAAVLLCCCCSCCYLFKRKCIKSRANPSPQLKQAFEEAVRDKPPTRWNFGICCLAGCFLKFLWSALCCIVGCKREEEAKGARNISSASNQIHNRHVAQGSQLSTINTELKHEEQERALDDIRIDGIGMPT